MRTREFFGLVRSCVAMHPSSLPAGFRPLPRGPIEAGVRPRDPADAELVRQMSAGSEVAFATFYDRFAPGLFSMIYAILRDQKESEDVLQEAFVQMWKRTATYDPAPEQPVYLGGDDLATQGDRSAARQADGKAG